MDYEKAYKEALERARKLYERGTITESLGHVFPELAESEDERIRKELITHCRNTRCVTEEGAESIVKWIAWLEKQKSVEWSEEDELMLLSTIQSIEMTNGAAQLKINWLKSLKERMK